MSIDVGGSGLKAMLLDSVGKPVSERERIPTPAIPTPRACLKGFDKLKAALPAFDRVSIGFPGVVKRGITWNAFNLHPLWGGFPLQAELEKRWHKPVRVANDACIQGYGAIKGVGLEMVITLGTGMGSRCSPAAASSRSSLATTPGRSSLTRTTSVAAAWTNTARSAGTSTSSKRSTRPPLPSTGTTSTWAAATPRRSTSSCPSTSASSPTKPGCSAAWPSGATKPSAVSATERRQ